MHIEDERLIARYLEGDPAAVRVIDEWFTQAARPFRQRLVCLQQDVRQAVHQKLCGLLRQGAFRGESRLRTYFWQVVITTCLRHLREQVKQTHVALDPYVPQLEATPDDSPLNQLLRKESEHLRLRTLEKLPSPCRQLVVRILEGQSYQQISEAMGLSEGALRIRAWRCRKEALQIYRRLCGDKS